MNDFNYCTLTRTTTTIWKTKTEILAEISTLKPAETTAATEITAATTKTTYLSMKTCHFSNV